MFAKSACTIRRSVGAAFDDDDDDSVMEAVTIVPV